MFLIRKCMTFMIRIRKTLFVSASFNNFLSLNLTIAFQKLLFSGLASKLEVWSKSEMFQYWFSNKKASSGLQCIERFWATL